MIQHICVGNDYASKLVNRIMIKPQISALLFCGNIEKPGLSEFIKQSLIAGVKDKFYGGNRTTIKKPVENKNRLRQKFVNNFNSC